MIRVSCRFFFLFVVSGALVTYVAANPTGGHLVAGEATMSGGAGGMTIQQISGRAIIDWDDFSIGVGELTRFVQPDAASIALNRVISGHPSSLLGDLQANGQVYLINPNGILVGAGARVDTAGFLASTLTIAENDFLDGGDLFFAGDSTAAITNLGTIGASGGDIHLIARKLENAGTLTAPAGTVGLAAGSEVLLTTGGAERIFVRATTAPGALVNSGDIAATTAELKAAGGNAYALAINNTGVVRATGAEMRGGRIWLVAGTEAPGDAGHRNDGAVANTGLLVATDADGAGGWVETSGETLADLSGSVRTGLGGEWLIDPTNITVDATLATSTVTTLNAGTNVTLDTSATAGSDAGDITVASPVTWTGTGTLTLDADRNIALNAGITGTAGGLTLLAGGGITTGAAGTVNVKTFILSDGDWVQNSATLPAFSATDFRLGPLGTAGAPGTISGSFLRVMGGDGSSGSPYLLGDVYGLQGMASPSLLASHFALVKDIDASGTDDWNFVNSTTSYGFVGAGSTGTPFTGSLDGRYHVIDGLFMNRSAGLFSVTQNATIRRLGLTDFSLRLPGTPIGGGLVGTFQGGSGVINQVHVSGALGSRGPRNNSEGVGGVVGIATGGTISQVSAAMSNASGSPHGGLVGTLNGATLSEAYAMKEAPAAAPVSAGAIGRYVSGTVSNVYWDSTTHSTGVGTGSPTGVTGLTTEQLTGSTLPAGFDSELWVIDDGVIVAQSLSLAPVFWWQRAVSFVTGTGGGAGMALRMNGVEVSNRSGSNGLFSVAPYATVAMQSDGSTVIARTSYYNYGTDVPRLVYTPGGGSSGGATLSLQRGATSGIEAGKFRVVGSATTLSGVHSALATAAGSSADTGLLFDAGSTLNSLHGGVGLNFLLNTTGFDFDVALQLSGHDVILKNDGTGAFTATAAFTAGDFQLDSADWYQNSATLPSFSVGDFDVSTNGSNSFLRVSGGDGSAGAPYKLADLYGLQGAAGYTYRDKHFILMADIDASTASTWNGGQGFSPFGRSSPYSGVFDGNGKTITGLVVNNPSSAKAGMFSELSGSVKNLGLVGGSVTGNVVASGFLAAWLKPGGTIANSYATGSVSGTADTGGLVGVNEGTITKSYARGAVTTTGVGSPAGGLVGLSSGTIDETYASGRVEGPVANPYLGGLVGRSSGGTITDSYFDVTVNSAAALANGLGATRTTAQLQSGSFSDVPGFETGTWRLSSGSYPSFGVTPLPTFTGTVTGGGAGIGLTLWINGASVATTTTTAGGAFSFDYGTDLTAGTTALVFATGGSGTVGNRLVPLGTGGTSNVTVAPSTVWMTSTATTLTSLISDLSATAGALSDAGLLYSVSGGTLSLDSGIGLRLDVTGASFNVNTALGLAGHAVEFNSTGDLNLNAGISTGSGSLTLRSNDDIFLASGQALTTTGGNLTLNADRDASSAGSIQLASGSSLTSGGGDIVLGGGSTPTTTAAYATDATAGVRLNGATISSGAGAVSIRGHGGSQTATGVSIENAATVGSAAGAITVVGTGAGTGGNHHGILVYSNSTIRSTGGGAIALTGQGSLAGTGSNNEGVKIQDGSVVEVQTGAGNLTITGTGGTGINYNIGVNNLAGTIRLGSGATGTMSVTGTGGSASGTGNWGVLIENSAVYESLGAGGIVFSGTGGTGADNIGIRLTGGASNRVGSSTMTGSITLNADTIDLAGSGTVTVQSSGALLLQPLNTATTIGVGDGATGTFNLGTTEISRLQDGFSRITIGRSDGTGAIDVRAATFSDHLRLLNTGAGSGGISLAGALSVGSNQLWLSSAGTVTQSAALTAGSLLLNGAGAFTLTHAGNSASTLAAQVSGASLAYTNSGSLTIGTVGGTEGVSAGANDVTLRTVSGNLTLSNAVTTSGAGNITLATAGNFINNAGASALSVGTGHWRVWSTSPLLDTRGGLAYDYKQYGATYGSTTVLGTGKGFLYTLAPTVSVGLTGTVSREYDGTATATLASGNYVVTGAVDGDSVTFGAPTATTYDTKNLGSGKAVSVTGINITGGTNGAAAVYGYTLGGSNSATANIGTITAKSLSVSGVTASDKVYDGSTAASISIGSATLVGVIGGESVSLNSGSAAGVFADRNVGTDKTVTLTGLTLSGADASNYTFVQPTGLLADITPAPLTVTASSATRLYGQGNPVFGATLTGLVGGDTASTIGAGLAFATPAGASSDVGSYAITPSGVSSANYNVTYQAGTLTVTPAPLTVAAVNASRDYGEANPEFRATYSGFVLGQDSSVLGGSLAFATGAGATSPVGNYTVTPSGLTSSNYTLSFVPGTLSIGLMPLTVTALDRRSVYGAALPAFDVSIAGFIGSDNVSLLGGSLTYTTTATVASAVGTYTVTPGGLTSDRYAITFVPGTLSISPAALTVAADNVSRSFNQPNPAFTATLTGLVNGDSGSVVSGLQFNTAATVDSTAGRYTIEPLGATAANYTITFVPGTLTVTSPAVVVDQTPVEVPSIGGTPVLSDTIAVVVVGNRFFIVPVQPAGDGLGSSTTSGTSLTNSIDAILGQTLGTTGSMTRLEGTSEGFRVTTPNEAVGAGGGVAATGGGLTFSGFEIVAVLGGGAGGSGGGAGGAGGFDPGLANEPGLFRETSVDLGGFNLVYREVLDEARALSEEGSAFGSSYSEFLGDEQPQVILLRAVAPSAPVQPTGPATDPEST
ncbi:MAG TPA: MBG domain-containing protein [Opitutaceae bacterium]